MRNRPRNAFLAFLVLPFLLAGCGSGSDAEPDAKMTEIAIACPEFEDTAKKITDAQAELYGGSGGSEAVGSLLAELRALEKGAPADVRAALSDLEDAFRAAQQVMEEPTADAAAALAKLGSKLSEDSQKITEYVTAKCS